MKPTCLIVYASMTGNTEEIANLIGEGIVQAGADLETKDILEAEPADLEKYDGILLGAYSWGDGDLPDEFLDFYDEMDTLNLAGKKAAAFGSCDSSYDHVGGAVDHLTEKLTELGAELVLEGLKIDGAPDTAESEDCIQFGRTFAENLF